MARVLVVDDEPNNRDFIVTLLHYGGHETLEAADGRQALAAVRKGRPDLVICDILMPTMDGYEFVHRLRGDADVAHTRVIFCSATFLEQEARQLAHGCGVLEVLMKPCEPQDVINAVSRSLAAPVAQAQLPLPDGAVEGDGRAPLIAHGAYSPYSATKPFGLEHLRLVSDKLLDKTAELQRVNQRLSALNELNLHLASEQDPHTLLDRLCRGSRELFGGRFAVLCAQDARDDSTVHHASWGLDVDAQASLQTLRCDQGLPAQVMRDGQSLRFSVPNGIPSPLGLGEDFPALSNGMVAPIASLERVHGWILVADKVGSDSFSAEDEELLAAHAAQAGRIYQNGGLYQQLQQHMAALQHEMAERQRQQAALRQSQAQLAGLVASAMDAIVGVDEQQRVVLFNAAATRMFGYQADEATGQPLSRLVHEAAGEGATSDDALRRLTGQHRDGRMFPIEAAVSVVAADGLARTFILRDISARVEADQRIRRLHRVASVLSDVNSLIVRVRSRAELFDEACRIAVEVGAFKKAWIGEVHPQSARPLNLVASRGDDPDYIARLQEEMAAFSDQVRDVLGPALEGETVVVDDLQPSSPGLLGQAAASGSRSVVWLPLKMDGQTAAVLALHAEAAGFFDAEELKLLRELAGDMSFALQHLAQEEQIRRLAYYDTLTGLANDVLALERLDQHMAIASAGTQQLGLALLDITRFKNINDTLGRHAGDAVLRQVAARLVASTGEQPGVSRIAADRFAVVFAEVRDEAELARSYMQHYERCFGAPFTVDGQELRIAARAGIALYPHDGQNAESLFRNAEAALKQAKSAGETLLFYNPRMTASVAESLALESRLRQALEREEFVLHYQPKVDTDDRSVRAVEALIRWQSPDLGLVPPLKFVPFLEETGLIVPVGEWALRRAVADHQRWRALGIAAPRIAVNVSAMQLRRPDFVDTVSRVLSPVAEAPCIDLEVTESVLMSDIEGSITKLAALRAMGVQVGLDDFGTGYSSLAYLARLPAQVLKIDRTFISTMLSDPNHMMLVSTMISLAHSLRLQVVAEGVETEEQAKILRLLRCDQIQGYLVARPMPETALLDWLQQRSAG